MLPRLVLPGLLLTALLAAPQGAASRPDPAAKTGPAPRLSTEKWVSMVVTRISRAGETPAAATPGGTVTIRLRIGADGTMESASIDESSGSEALDSRALAAAKAASPFAPPPERLLTLEGFTELAFPVEFGRSP